MRRDRIERWDPDDPAFWGRTGRRVANRNLWFSVFSEHIGFSVWSIWSVLVLFMGPAYGVDPAGKFLLVSIPTLFGALLRVPYSLAVAKFGGRTWTVISACLLLIPCVLAGFVLHAGVSYGALLLVAVFAGFGGGNFASSMTNINAFFPEQEKGRALGINAGGGNLGVAGVQLVGPLVIGTAGAGHPRILLWIYIPLIVLSATLAALFMDNLATTNDVKALRAAGCQPQTWILSFLYIGTFGSFIGYSFAFGLVLQNQFGRTPLQAAALTFIGPLVGSVGRPAGGWLADRISGSRITTACFAAMAVGAVVVIAASEARSLGTFLAGFIALFVFSGIGSGSVYKMIPAAFSGQPDGGRISGAVIGIAGGVGALGGLLINLAFRESFLNAQSGVPAFIGFLAFYGVCLAVTFAVYLRRPGMRTELAYAGQR